MNKTTLNKIAIISVLIFIFYICLIFTDKLKIFYIQVFNKSAIISHRNDNGRLNGEYFAFINGNIFIKSFFKDGLREGWCTWYDEATQKKKREVFFKKGVADGIENVYYPNGKLNYSTQWKNGRYCNSEYHYSENGILNTYNAFDNSKEIDNGYCYVAYDRAGKFHQILGHVFSSYIYSMCGDSIVALLDNRRYKCVNELCINIATPPQLMNNIEIIVNNKVWTESLIKKNTIIVPNVFRAKCAYQISIFGKLLNSSGRIIKTDTLKMSILKK